MTRSILLTTAALLILLPASASAQTATPVANNPITLQGTNSIPIDDLAKAAEVCSRHRHGVGPAPQHAPLYQGVSGADCDTVLQALSVRDAKAAADRDAADAALVAAVAQRARGEKP